MLYNSVLLLFLAYSESCIPSLQSNFRIPSSFQKETLFPFAVTLHYPLAPAPGNYHSTSCFYRFLCGLLCLTSLTQHSVFKTHPYCSSYQYFIPSHWWIIFHCLDIPHSVYPFTSWWTSLSCFYFLAKINYASMSMYVQVFVWMYVFCFFWIYRVSQKCVYTLLMFLSFQPDQALSKESSS